MKSQDLFSLKIKKNNNKKLSSAAVVIGALRVKIHVYTSGTGAGPGGLLRGSISDQSLYYLPLTQQFYTHSQVVKWTC